MSTLVKVIKTGKIFKVWSDNTDEQSYSCLPLESRNTLDFDPDCSWINDLIEFKYNEVEVVNCIVDK